MIRAAVFLSGRGSNFLSLKEKIDEGYIPNTEIALVFSNKPEAPGLKYAESAGLATFSLPAVDFPDRETYDAAIIKILKEYEIGLICLAGYMRILSKSFVEEYAGKIINIHPSLLPAFKGACAQRQALEYGARFSGCTVHFVDAGMDTGPIIAQRVVPVFQNDTEESLSERILKEEHILYPEAVKMFAQGRLEIINGKVAVKDV